MSEYGVVTSPTSLCFTRVLPASVERVWAFLTESDKRGLWLATGDMELREGGGVTLRFVHADLSSVADHLTVRVDDQRPDGDVAGRQRGPRLRESGLHEGVVRRSHR